MREHIDIAGLVLIIWGAINILMGLLAGGFMALASVFAFLGGTEELMMMGIIYGVATVVVAVMVLAVGGAFAFVGYSLRQRRPWSRMGAMVLGVLSLLNFPLGTILGIYVLYVMFDQDVVEAFEEAAAAAV